MDIRENKKDEMNGMPDMKRMKTLMERFRDSINDFLDSIDIEEAERPAKKGKEKED